MEIVFHFFINLGQVKCVLCRIFKHFFGQRPLTMPKGLISFHLIRNCFLIFILDFLSKILLQKTVESYLVLISTGAEILCCVVNDTMCNLGVKHAFAVDTVMIYQSRTIFTEIMKNLYVLLRRQYLLEVEWESIVKRVTFLQVKQVAVAFEAQLQERNRMVA